MSLPTVRAKAGKRAHLRCYKKLTTFSNIAKVFEFLKIPHNFTHVTPFKLFFEVSFGKRVADAIIVVQDTREMHCFIIEFKTCKGKSINMTSVTRQAQIVEGKKQLLDTTQIVAGLQPTGPRRCYLHAYLIFKSQRDLVTLYSHKLKLMTISVCTQNSTFLNYLATREDRTVRNKVAPPTACLTRPSNVLFLGTTPKKYPKNQPSQPKRGAALSNSKMADKIPLFQKYIKKANVTGRTKPYGNHKQSLFKKAN